MLPDCAEALRPIWEQADTAGTRPFRAGGPAGAMPHVHALHTDLERAGIPRRDERGRWADFHSFRYSFCTWMGRQYPIQKVKVLMRHSTIKLTADLYTDLGIDDVAEAEWMLEPMFRCPERTAIAAGDR